MIRLFFAYAFFLLSLAFTLAAYGQQIDGRVLDESHTPIAYANIVVLSADSAFIQGTISNAEGHFGLTAGQDAAKAEMIRISFVGYESRFLPYRTGNLGDISLTPSAQMLQETVVSAKLPTFRLTAEGIKTTIAGSVLSQAGTANDVLARLPNVDGGGGSFSVFGKGQAAIYLNGRQVFDPTVLGRLTSEEIEEVEVISNPGARYNNAVKAVIRIKTKKKTGEGWSGILQALYGQGHRSDGLGSVYLNYRKNNLDVFGSVYYTEGYQKQEQSNTEEIYGRSRQQSESHILTHTRSISGMVGLTYDINERHAVGMQYNVDKQPLANAEMQMDMRARDLTNGREEDLQYDTEADMPSGANHLLNAYYVGQAGQWNIDFNVDALFNQSGTDQYTQEHQADALSQEVTTRNRSKANMVATKLILTRPIGNGKLSFGGEYTRTHRTNTFSNEQGLLNEADDKIVESSQSAFAEYSLGVGRWTLNAGLRFQHTTSDYYEYGVHMPGQSRKYNDLLPNLSVGRMWGNVQTQLSYTVKKSRPSYYMLSSNVQYDNRYMYEGGNPLLQPSTTHDLTLSASLSVLQASVSYLRRKDIMLNTYRMYNDDAIFFTYDNFDKVDEINAQFSVSPEIMGFWYPSYSVQVSKQFIDEARLGVKEKLEKPIFRFKLFNTFNLPWKLMARVDFTYSTRGNSEVSLIEKKANLNLTLNKNFLNNKLRVYLQATDVLKTGRSKSYTYSPYHYSYRNNYSDSRKVYVVVHYFFNATKSKYKGRGAGNEEKVRL